MCPLCKTAADSEAAYFRRAFGEPRWFAATGEAVADALGFCARHTAGLLAYEVSPEAIRAVFCEAIPRLALVFEEKHMREPHVQQALFSAESACPACTYVNRAVGRQVAALARQPALTDAEQLCVAHFQIYAASLRPEFRLPEIIQHIEHLRTLGNRLKPLLNTPNDEAAIATGNGVMEVLDRILVSIVGEASHGCNEVQACSEEPNKANQILAVVGASTDNCRLCIEADHAQQSWLRTVPNAITYDQDAWLVLPICPSHIRVSTRIEKPGVAAAILAHALSVELRYARQYSAALTRAAELQEEEARIRAEGPEVWEAYKRKRMRGKTGPQKNLMPRLPKCPACERMSIAVDHAAGKLLDTLYASSQSETQSQHQDLCWKHSARLYFMAPHGSVRSRLAEYLQNKLSEAMRYLAGLVH